MKKTEVEVHCRKHWVKESNNYHLAGATFADFTILHAFILKHFLYSVVFSGFGGSTCPIPETLAEPWLFTVGYWVSQGLEWSGVGCGSHIPPETQITLQETPALQDTHCLTRWFINIPLYGTHTLSHRHTLQISVTRSESVLHLHPLLTFLLSFPSFLSFSAQSQLLFSPCVLTHNKDKQSVIAYQCIY